MRTGFKIFRRPHWLTSDSAKFIVAGVVVVIAGALISACFWNWLGRPHSATTTNGDTVRNVGFLIGGVLAIIFGVWRALVAERQASASQGQTETGQKVLLNERYQQGAAMLGSETLAVRLGGIYALQQLATEYPEEYHLQIMRLLCAFVRNPTKDADLDRTVYIQGDEIPPSIRDDVQAAVSAIGWRNPNHIRYETEVGFKLDLHGSNLRNAYLQQHFLEGADFNGASLEYSDLQFASLKGSILTNANLFHAKLLGSDFSLSCCKWAMFSATDASHANFRRAYLEGTIWINAELDAADLTTARLIGADLTAAKLNQTIISDAWFGEGTRLVGDPPYEIAQRVFTSITQAQLNKAVADNDAPPKIDRNNNDTETGVRLEWHTD